MSRSHHLYMIVICILLNRILYLESGFTFKMMCTISVVFYRMLSNISVICKVYSLYTLEKENSEHALVYFSNFVTKNIYMCHYCCTSYMEFVACSLLIHCLYYERFCVGMYGKDDSILKCTGAGHTAVCN